MRRSPARELPLGDGTGKIGALKARAVLIDMEEGVINSMLSGPLGEVFDPVLKVCANGCTTSLCLRATRFLHVGMARLTLTSGCPRCRQSLGQGTTGRWDIIGTELTTESLFSRRCELRPKLATAFSPS